MYIVIFIGYMNLSLIISQVLKSKFSKYSAIAIGKGYIGIDVAD